MKSFAELDLSSIAIDFIRDSCGKPNTKSVATLSGSTHQGTRDMR